MDVKHKLVPVRRLIPIAFRMVAPLLTLALARGWLTPALRLIPSEPPFAPLTFPALLLWLFLLPDFAPRRRTKSGLAAAARSFSLALWLGIKYN